MNIRDNPNKFCKRYNNNVIILLPISTINNY